MVLFFYFFNQLGEYKKEDSLNTWNKHLSSLYYVVLENPIKKIQAQTIIV